MTQTLPRTAPPPVLPVTVYAQHRGDGYVLHEASDCHRGTFPANTAAIRRGDMRWCARCWPGRRCVICRAPSGEWGECAQCCALAAFQWYREHPRPSGTGEVTTNG